MIDNYYFGKGLYLWKVFLFLEDMEHENRLFPGFRVAYIPVHQEWFEHLNFLSSCSCHLKELCKFSTFLLKSVPRSLLVSFDLHCLC